MNKNRQKNNLTRRNLLTLGTSLLGTTLLGTTSKVALAKAPFLGTYSSTFFRFKLAEFEITTISDGEAVIKTAHPIFGANAKKEEVNKVLKSNLLPENIFNPFFTPTIINTGKEVILFDTGNGDDGFAGRPHAGNLVKQLAVAGFKPEEIDIVVLSHGHSDHIGGLEYLTLKNRYFGQPKGKPRLTMIIPDEYRTVLWDESLKGGLRYNELGKYENEMTFESYFDYVTPTLVEKNARIKHQINFKGIELEFFHTNHIPGQAVKTEDAFITYGLLIDGKVFFSGDTKFDKELVEEYKDKADYLFHDCSFFPNPVHADIDSLRTFPEDLRKRIVLMHYGDDYANHDYSDFHGLAEPGVRYIFD